MIKWSLSLLAVAFIAAVIGLSGEGETSNVIWLIFFGSLAGAFYLYWKARGSTTRY
jgi:uncharacterized membrane protein YtjA (UPF0391 family)